MQVMTFAPQSLLDLRAYLKPVTGLPDNDLGIVGDKFHKGGYHHGKSMLVSNDYSARTGRDKAGLTEAASAFDLGMFPKLRELSVWCVGQCQARHPDTLDIREIVYTPDGKVVWRWDREHGNEPYISGDPSHLTHSHFSFYRDSEFRDKRPLFRRFFEGENDMTPEQSIHFEELIWRMEAVANMRDTYQGGQSKGLPVPFTAAVRKLQATMDEATVDVTLTDSDLSAISAQTAAALRALTFTAQA